jgi:hypothetical protein
MATAATVTARVPPDMQPPAVDVDCRPIGIELMQAFVARMERRLIVDYDDRDLVRWAKAQVESQRRLLAACGASPTSDRCFDLRRDLAQESQVVSPFGDRDGYAAYGSRASVERARDRLRACERGAYSEIRW